MPTGAMYAGRPSGSARLVVLTSGSGHDDRRRMRHRRSPGVAPRRFGPLVYRVGTLGREHDARRGHAHGCAAPISGHARPFLARKRSEVVIRATPETRNRAIARFSRALCRTRTGDPFLTMAVRLRRAATCGTPKRLRRCQIRDSAGARSGQHRSALSVTHSVPGQTTARAVGQGGNRRSTTQRSASSFGTTSSRSRVRRSARPTPTS